MINGAETTYFVGAHYEVTDGVVTKYYYAGTQRIAMRTNGALNYLLGDHLGSTSLSADAAGNVISELRYKAWGEVRFASGTTPTDYTYTGQYSYASDFGLMYYNARWYDPSLGRFNQPDTVVPDAVQGYDRYAYSNNNPVRYIDPSGHNPILLLILAAVVLTACAPDPVPENADVLIASTVNIVDEEGEHFSSGTQISDDTFLTHDHYDLTATSLSELGIEDDGSTINLEGNLVSTNESDQWIGGTSWITMSEPLSGTTAPVASQETIMSIQPGDYVDVVYWDDWSEQFNVESFEVMGFDTDEEGHRTYISINFDGSINPGDSGGGIFYNGELIGNVSNIWKMGPFTVSGQGALIPYGTDGSNKGKNEIK